MCKSKKIIALMLSVGIIFSLSGCNVSDKLMTDTGSGKQEEIPREDYLITDALSGDSSANSYTVHTLTKGKFEEEALRQILKQSYINVPTVRFSLEGMSATFGEYKIQNYQYVDEGDVIATVHTEADEIALEEAKVKLQRLEERYQEASKQAEEDLQALVDEGPLTYNSFKREILKIRYTQKKQDWEYQKYNYESQIAEAKEELAQLTQVGTVYNITATMDGYVNYSKKHSAGAEMKNGDYICHILNSSEIYTILDNQAEYFHYGMEVTFDNLNGMTPAKVVNGGSWALYGNLDTGRIIFRLDFEQDVSELNSAGLNNLILKGLLKEMDNVILIPKSAVSVEEEQYYVTVLKEDGSLLKTEFIPGGSNLENYWVLDGLTEGMQIVYN